MFVDCLNICFFYFDHLRTPTGSCPENFMKIQLDLAEILRIRKLDWKMFMCLFVCLFVYRFVFCFNHRRITTGSFPQNSLKIQLDLAEILRISKLDWRGGGGKKGRRRGRILPCNGLIIMEASAFLHLLTWSCIKYFVICFEFDYLIEYILENDTIFVCKTYFAYLLDFFCKISNWY